MTEAAVRWSPAQQSMLRELGCELFAVRGEREPTAATPRRSPEHANPDAGVPRPSGEIASRPDVQRSTPATASSRGRRMLIVLSPDANWLRGPHSKLARAVLAALGVKEDEVRGEPLPGVPTLCFGRQTPGAVQAPALAALRDAHAKRALWPALRALRRRLREGAGA